MHFIPFRSAHVPPQSTSVSKSSFSLLKHCPGETQVPSVHIPVAQSAGAEHLSPSRHFLQLFPPQSTPVSSWFLTLSVQLAFAHSFPRQYPVPQSAFWAQLFFSAHFAAQLPPQSVSASSLSFFPFLHASSMFRLTSTITPGLSFASLHNPALFCAFALMLYFAPSFSCKSVIVISSLVVVVQLNIVPLPETTE